MAATVNARSLASWNEGAAKSQILDFVARVAQQDGPEFVPSEDRIAVFDNDGTLWCEQPLQVQVFFLITRVKELAEKDATLNQRQPFKALLELDLKTLVGLGKQALLELVFATHSGMEEEEFEPIAREWLAKSKHPKFGRLFKHCTYQPQLELLDFLEQNRFKTYIVSGGGIDFMRACAEEIYGIPRERVIGSSNKLRFEMNGDRAGLVKLAELNSFDDREAKPENIALHVGRRPILAFGNSDGDLPMFRYTKTGEGPRMALLLHHDDGEREVAYDREFRVSPLSEGLDKAGAYGITVVSMKRDWDVIFPKAS
jgi:phosphoserine phosphatase